MEKFNEKMTILITGATAGIGKATTIRLLNEGYNVCFCGRSPEKMADLLAILKEIPSSQYHYQTFDLFNDLAIEEFIHQSEQKFSKIDVLINNAGANIARAKTQEIKIEDFEYMLKLNAIIPLKFMQKIANSMCLRKAGTIINILSSACLYSNEGIGAYTASKTALEGLTSVFRREMRPHHVKVCAIYPGGVNTAFRPNTREDYLNVESVVDAIVSVIKSSPSAAIDEIIVRPFVETNFP